MERWENQVAVVTGASSGIGASIFESLALAGLIVIGVARRVQEIQKIIDRQPPEVAFRMRAASCDVRSTQSVDDTYCYITDNFGGIDILIDNAGIFEDGMLLNMEMCKLRNVFSTNLLGYIYWARKAIQSLTERNATGHIILINSSSTNKFPVRSTNAYSISKNGISALRETLADELRILNNRNIKVTSISPSVTNSSMWKAEDLAKVKVMLQPRDISDAVLYVLGTPKNVEIGDLTISPL